MANPFRRADQHGAPSIRPTPPESAEAPMPDPMQIGELTRDLPVNRPVAPPSAEDTDGTTAGTATKQYQASRELATGFTQAKDRWCIRTTGRRR